MTMDDLISRSKLLKSFDIAKMVEYDETGCGVTRIAIPIDTIRNAPTVDAVHVVRCKDCVLWRPVGENTGKCPFLIGEHQYTGDDHFCSCGERKEDAE